MTIKVKSLVETFDDKMESREKLRRTPRWGRWRFRRRAFVLEHSDHGYQIPLERCGNPVAVLDWLAHMSEKSWCTPEDVGQLLLAFKALLFLFDNDYCGKAGDETKPVNVYKRLKASGWIGAPRK